MNPILKHFFFSSLKNQLEKDIKKTMPQTDCGCLVSIAFIVTHEKIIQRVKFEKYEGDSVLTPDEKKKFCSMVSIDVDKEMIECKSIFCILNVPKKNICITYNYLDSRENKTINL